jgi:hypothetical protein
LAQAGYGVHRIMRVMRHIAARLMTMLLYSCSVLILPTLSVPARPLPSAANRSNAETCSCPMCRTAGPAAMHCSCCNGDTCTCQLSSNDQETPIPPAPKPCVLRTLNEPLVILNSEPLYLQSPQFTSAPYFPVPSPPPKPQI